MDITAMSILGVAKVSCVPRRDGLGKWQQFDVYLPRISVSLAGTIDLENRNPARRTSEEHRLNMASTRPSLAPSSANDSPAGRRVATSAWTRTASTVKCAHVHTVRIGVQGMRVDRSSLIVC